MTRKLSEVRTKNLIALGQVITDLRKSQQIKASRLAYLLDVTPQTINAWEHGKCEITLTMLRRLATALDITAWNMLALADWLITNPNTYQAAHGHNPALCNSANQIAECKASE